MYYLCLILSYVKENFFSSCYIHVYHSSKFNLHFCHTYYVVGTLIGALPILAYSISIIILSGRYYHYPTLAPFSKRRIWSWDRLINLLSSHSYRVAELGFKLRQLPSKCMSLTLHYTLFEEIGIFSEVRAICCLLYDPHKFFGKNSYH